MDILLCTHNKNKVRELHSLISASYPQVNVLSLTDIGHTEDIVEDGTTFEQNALIKARYGAALGYASVADDSGLEVDALGGAPGVYSARYAGEPCDDRANNELLLSKLSGIPHHERTGRYVSVIACVFPDGRSFTVRGECQGIVLSDYVGDGGFGYDPLFWQIELEKTFAEITIEEKNTVSHRARAMQKFAEEFGKYI